MRQAGSKPLAGPPPRIASLGLRRAGAVAGQGAPERPSLGGPFLTEAMCLPGPQLESGAKPTGQSQVSAPPAARPKAGGGSGGGGGCGPAPGSYSRGAEGPCGPGAPPNRATAAQRRPSAWEVSRIRRGGTRGYRGCGDTHALGPLCEVLAAGDLTVWPHTTPAAQPCPPGCSSRSWPCGLRLQPQRSRLAAGEPRSLPAS